MGSIPVLTEGATIDCMGDSSNRAVPPWLGAFDELAAFRDRIFAKVGKRPHKHTEKVNWATFDCAECIEWQERYDAAFKEELDELAALRDRVFVKVGQRPHAHREKTARLGCTECIAWQTQFDAAFKEGLDELKNR
jgi:hypothetical protein